MLLRGPRSTATTVLRWDARVRRSNRVRGVDSRRVAGTAALVACISVLTGCATPLAGVVRTSGALADGFEIEPGSALIGPVFPGSDGGWRAILGVRGDMQGIFDGYVQQAEELGHPLQPGLGRDSARQWCSDRRDGVVDDDLPGGAFVVECRAYVSEPGEWRLSVTGRADRDGRGFIELRGGSPSSEDPPPVPDGPVAAVTDVEVAELSVYGALRRVEGSELLLDPFPSGCDRGSFIAMLRVTGDVVPVMRAYAEQFDDAGFANEGPVGDEDQPRVWGGLPGGGDVTAASTRGDPSYLVIERCVTN